MKKAVITLLSAVLMTTVLTTTAFARELIVGGQVVGIQISTKGVLVAGVSAVETASGSASPAENAGVCAGDIICKADGIEVKSAAELIASVAEKKGSPVKLTVKRGGKLMEIRVQPVLSAEEQWMMGMWLRDGISGIGTVTFCDPSSGVFGALGHGICDADTGVSVPMNKGNITDAEIVSITPGTCGTPGELNGCADPGRILGSIDVNSAHGVFGKSYISFGTKTLETGDIRPGSALMIATTNGKCTKEYAVEITRVYKDGDGEHAMLTVTDAALREQTGGIVQGMSGSPIIQDGKLVGAVTHVFVNDPTRGYAVSIYDMLKAAGIAEKAA